ncbi:MAG: hypothetical protein V4543_17780 [Bacteroidota bacterium]
MKLIRIVVALAIMASTAGCMQYKTCATYAKKTTPAHDLKQDRKSV